MPVHKNELYHHGIKGQKWGVRRFRNEDGSLTEAGKQRYNENYSAQQRTRDQKLYGRGGVKRINKRMNAGEGIQSARHNEVVRQERILGAKRIGKTVAKGAIVIAGSTALVYYLHKKGLGDASSSMIAEQTVNVGKSVVSAIIRT